MEKISVVVAEDEYFTREGICSILEKEPQIEVIGQVDNGVDAITFVLEHKPTVLLLDIRMPPGINGLEVIKRLRDQKSDILIIALTGEKRLVKAVEERGGNGYVPKDKHQMFIPTVLYVAQTGSNIFINPDLTEAYREVAQRVEKAKLSAFEKDVWRLLRYTNEEIAKRLNRSTGRIRNVVADLYFKLDITESAISKRVQATELGRLYGILEDPDEVIS